MTTENTGQESDFLDLSPDAKAAPLLRGGPVILIEVETGNLGSPVRMQNQMDIVRDISQRLDAVDIGYMLTGSMALNCYALPCPPRNLDFVVALQPADAEIVVRLFNSDYDISREAVDSAIAQPSAFGFTHRKTRLKVNFLICRRIKYRLMEFSRRQRVQIENFRTWLVSKEDLIISKLHWARESHTERHLRDVKNLAATGCDTAYVERWTRALGIFNLWEECSQR